MTCYRVTLARKVQSLLSVEPKVHGVESDLIQLRLPWKEFGGFEPSPVGGLCFQLDKCLFVCVVQHCVGYVSDYSWTWIRSSSTPGLVVLQYRLHFASLLFSLPSFLVCETYQAH